MIEFRTKEAENYFYLTKNEALAKRLDNAIENAEFFLYGVKHAQDKKRYEEAKNQYLNELAILREYGIFAI